MMILFEELIISFVGGFPDYYHEK